MGKRNEAKSIEEYIKELAEVASASEVETCKKLWQEGKRIQAIQLLHKYNIKSD